MKYYIDKTISDTFENVVERVKLILPNFGFGVVTEFDIDKKLKNKLGIEFRPYKVIGACNPKYAYEALQTEPLIGTMLPCNIIVQLVGEELIQVAAVDPVASMAAIDNNKLQDAAEFIKGQLTEIIKEV